MKPGDILTPEELAARLKVRKSWVYEQTCSRNRKPPSLQMGHYLRFDWAKVVEWLTDGEDGRSESKKRRK